MSNYFEKFPIIPYRFGDETYSVSFQKLNKFVDFVETLKDNIGAYIEYEILDFDRPDTLSYKLYEKSEYDWTFFLMNDRLRETGWPLSMNELYKEAQENIFPNYTALLDISTADSAAQYSDLYPVGQTVLVGTKEGIVVRKNLDVGEITISGDSDLTTATTLSYTDGSNEITLTNTVYEYEGTHHYETDSGEWIDYYFSTNPTKVPITNLEYLIAENDASKRIRVIKKRYIEEIVGRVKNLLEKE